MRYLSTIILAATIVFVIHYSQFVIPSAYAQTDQERIEQLRQQIEQLESQATQYRQNIASERAKADSLKKEIAILKNQIASLETQIALANKKIDKTELEKAFRAPMETMKNLQARMAKFALRPGNEKESQFYAVNQALRSRIVRGPFLQEILKYTVERIVEQIKPAVVNLARNQFFIALFQGCLDGVIITDILQHLCLFYKLQVGFVRDNGPFRLAILLDNLHTHRYTSPLGAIFNTMITNSFPRIS